MPKSKPPRRRRTVRHMTQFVRHGNSVYDVLDEELDRLLAQVAPHISKAPASEQASFARAVKEARGSIAEGRKDLERPSQTPVLDRLMRDAAKVRTRP